MSAELWAAVVVILGVIAEALRRGWMKADEQKRKEESDRAAADERDAGGLFNGP